MIQEIFWTQQAFSYQLRLTAVKERQAYLHKLKAVIREHEEEIYQALFQDLRKSRFESAVTEVFFVYAEIDFAIKHLRHWMKPQRAGRVLTNIFTKNRIYHEPKGVCLIIAPWNYPFQLVMSPLVSAVAAGNTVVIKPSEFSPATSKVLTKLISMAFTSQHVACVEGDASVAETLLALPFDHIFYTGSTGVGKLVMSAAAKNLSSVTLELGGKSPVLLTADTDFEEAVRKIAWGKLVNAGQTCIAPDYVLVPESRVDEFIGQFQKHSKQLFFNKKGEINLQAYGKIINQKHFNRIKHMVDEAVIEGARINWGGRMDEHNLTIHPIILTQLPEESAVMKEEIFGPVMPVIPYRDLQEAIDFINLRPKPLALYVFSKQQKNIQKIIRATSAGGTCVNDVLVHIANPNLPFGGVGHSGMGNCHGFYGFKTFSHQRSVVFQSRFNFNRIVYPPYENKNWVIKWVKRLM